MNATLSNVVQGQAMTQTLQATGGTPPYSWKAGTTFALPPGLSLSTGGILSGIPTSWGNQGVSVQISDSSSPVQTATGFFTLFVIQQLVIGDGAVPSPKNVGLAYSFTLSAFGGFGAHFWTLQNGSGPFPAGLTLDATSGTISGTPTVPGTYNFTVQVTDTGPPHQSASQEFSLVITNNVVVTNLSLPEGVVNKPFQAALQAAGGTPPYTWSFYGGNFLPTGIQLDPSTGIVSGTPTNSINTGQGFQVTDSSTPPQTGFQILQLNIQPQLSFTSSTLIDGMVGLVYNFPPLPIAGGILPYIAQVVEGTLPPGVTLQNSPAQTLFFSGIPTTPGNFLFTLQITDSETPPASIQQAFNVRIDPALVIDVPTSLPSGLEGQSYSYTFQASGGHPPYHWISSGIPGPPGLTVDPVTGLLSGTPTAAFNDRVVVFVEDSGNPVRSASVGPSLVILGKLRVTTLALPPIAQGVLTSIRMGASGGSGQYTWSLASGSIPPGLTFDAGTGTISGQATQNGASTFAVQVSDLGPPSQTSDPATIHLTVGTSLGRNNSIATATPLSYGTYLASISPISDPPSGVMNPDNDYYRLSASPGTIIKIEITANRLPSPSPLDSVLEIVDANGARLSDCGNLGAVGPPFNQSCLNDDLDSTTRDSGLSFQAPPNSLVPIVLYVHILDFRGDARPDMVYQLSISGILDTLKIVPVSLGAGATRGVSYQQQLLTTGGTGAMTWAVSTGTLPPGLSLNGTGLISGVPTANGIYRFTITTTDHGNPTQVAQLQSTFVIADPLVITSPAQLPDACANQPYSFPVQTSGGVPPFSWGFISDWWPAGLTLNQSTGVLSGTTAITGTFTGQVGVNDSSQPPTGQSLNFTLNVVTCP